MENPVEAAHRARRRLKLHAPALWVFVLSLVIAVLAVVSVLTPIPYITAYEFWVAILAYVILAVGNLVET
jgi:hypothetical protein